VRNGRKLVGSTKLDGVHVEADMCCGLYMFWQFRRDVKEPRLSSRERMTVCSSSSGKPFFVFFCFFLTLSFPSLHLTAPYSA
jgi:hypothetical protein